MGAILLATDGSPSAERATRAAIELATATGWPLRVVVAWAVPASAFGFGGYAPAIELSAAERQQAEETLAAALARVEEAGLTAHGRVREGEAVAEICTAARDWDASIVVVGAHGWGPVRRAVFGSVSSGLLHQAPCPVLVARVDAGD